MTYSYRIQYLKCQSCSAKVHCGECAKEITSYLMKEHGFNKVELNLEAKQILVHAENMTEDMIMDCLEDAELFTV